MHTCHQYTYTYIYVYVCVCILVHTCTCVWVGGVALLPIRDRWWPADGDRSESSPLAWVGGSGHSCWRLVSAGNRRSRHSPTAVWHTLSYVTYVTYVTRQQPSAVQPSTFSFSDVALEWLWPDNVVIGWPQALPYTIYTTCYTTRRKLYYLTQSIVRRTTIRVKKKKAIIL